MQAMAHLVDMDTGQVPPFVWQSEHDKDHVGDDAIFCDICAMHRAGKNPGKELQAFLTAVVSRMFVALQLTYAPGSADVSLESRADLEASLVGDAVSLFANIISYCDLPMVLTLRPLRRQRD